MVELGRQVGGILGLVKSVDFWSTCETGIFPSVAVTFFATLYIIHNCSLVCKTTLPDATRRDYARAASMTWGIGMVSSPTTFVFVNWAPCCFSRYAFTSASCCQVLNDLDKRPLTVMHLPGSSSVATTRSLMWFW